jgi:hypothetical protein
MKSLLVTLLIFASVFVAYDYFAAPVGEKIIFKSMNTPSADSAPAVESSSDSKEISPVATSTPPPSSTEPNEQTGTASQMPSPPPTSSATTATSAASSVKQPVDESGFVPPNFSTMETLTKGWTVIPSSAFPRPVTLKKDAAFKMSAGSISVRAGTSATALAFAQGQLQLAPNATSTARAVVPVDDTDLKDLLLSGYEKWKVNRVAILRDAHLRRLARAKSAPTTPIVASSDTVDAAGKPVQSASGSYPLLVAHLKSGEVTEIKAENVKRWGDAVATNWEGKPAYAVPVSCEVNTIFGLQPVDAQAIVVNGRVKGWFYSGSGEPVP